MYTGVRHFGLMVMIVNVNRTDLKEKACFLFQLISGQKDLNEHWNT